MRRFYWILLAICLTAFELWAVFAPTKPMNFQNQPILLPLIISAFVTSGLGGWWMLFKIVRHEKQVFPIILVPFLIPNAFLWYYFEVLVPKKELQG